MSQALLRGVAALSAFLTAAVAHAPPPSTAGVSVRIAQRVDLQQRVSFFPTTLRSPYPELMRRMRRIEDLILGLHEEQSLDELRPLIVALYPELEPDLVPYSPSSEVNRVRFAAYRYRLRHELISVVLRDYADFEAAIRSGGDTEPQVPSSP